MPIYEYLCTACGHRTDILHGVNEPGPHFCPDCGADGTMRKAIAAPAVHFKGSGWAKRDRRSGASVKAERAGDAGTESTTGGSKPAVDAPPGGSAAKPADVPAGRSAAKPADGASD
jgi:putative FmdB family regulatory protein